MHTATTADPDELLTRAEAAVVLRVKPLTLARWAARGVGPSYSRSGRRRGRCVYSRRDLAEWIASRRVQPGAAPHA